MWTPSESGDWLAVALVGISVAAIVAGLAIIGGPGKAREVQRDQIRLNALVGTAEALNCYSRGVGSLPEDLQVVRVAIADSGSPARLAKGCNNAAWKDDPVTGAPFDILPIDDQHAQICAVFERPTKDEPRYHGIGWHGPYIDSATPRPEAGRFCYTVNLVASPD